MKIFLFEIKKLAKKTELFIYFVLLLCANFFLLWFTCRPYGNEISPSRYRNLTAATEGLTEEEKKDLIYTDYETANGLNNISIIVNNYSENSSEFKKLVSGKYREDFANYSRLYASGGYLKYTDNIEREYKFLLRMKDEFDTVYGYKDFLRDIEERNETLSGISIFHLNGDYNIENIRSTAEAYKNLSDVEPKFSPQEGIVQALSFGYTDLCIFLFAILFSFYIVREEKESGMLSLICSRPRGRVKTALAKIFLLFLGMFLGVAMLYLTNILYCGNIYGLGDLTRPIQSVAYYIGCTLKVNVFQFIVIFIFTKFLACCVLGLWVMFSVAVCDNAFTAYLISISLPRASFCLKRFISGSSKFNFFKYTNLSGIMASNDILENFKNINFLGHPVPLSKVRIFSGIVYSVVFFVRICYVFAGHFISSSRRKFTLPVLSKQKPKSLFGWEMKKTLFSSGGALFLAVFVLFRINDTISAPDTIVLDEKYYGEYMRELTGPYDSDAQKFLIDESGKFTELAEAEEKFKLGLINSRQYREITEMNYALNMRYSAYKRVLSDIRSLSPGQQLIYKTGYIKLFDFDNFYDIYDYMIAILVCCVVFGGVFSNEKANGILNLIKTNPSGRRITVEAKLRSSTVLGAIICIVGIFPRAYEILNNYGVKGFFVPAMSMREFSDLPSFIPAGLLLILFVAGRALAILFAVFVVLYISNKCRNYQSAVMFSLFILEFPTVLYHLGVEWAGYLTFFRLFRVIPAIRTGGFELFLTFIYSVIAISALFIIRNELIDSYEEVPRQISD